MPIPILGHFTNLVREMRKLKLAEIYDVHMQLDPSEVIFALDAVPLLRTDAGVQFMVDSVHLGMVDAKRQDQWFATLANYKSPTRAMLASVQVG